MHYDKHRAELLDLLVTELLKILPAGFKTMVDNTTGGVFAPTMVANKFAGSLRPGTWLCTSLHFTTLPKLTPLYRHWCCRAQGVWTLTRKLRTEFLHNCIKEVFEDMKKAESAQPRLKSQEDDRHKSVNAIGVTETKEAAFDRSTAALPASPQDFLSLAVTPSRSKKRGRPAKNASVVPEAAAVTAAKKNHRDRLLGEKQCLLIIDHEDIDLEEDARYPDIIEEDFTNEYPVPRQAVTGCRLEDIKRTGFTIDSDLDEQRLSNAKLRVIIRDCGMGPVDSGHTFITFPRSVMSAMQTLHLDSDERLAKAMVLAVKGLIEHSDS